MEPRIQYATASDGTRIAYSTFGQGKPLVTVRGIWLNSMEGEWQIPEARQGIVELARSRTVVTYVYGGAVNIAARIAAASAPGEVLLSETVRSLARTSAGVGFDDRGEQELKGVGEPVRLWAVQGAK